MLAAEEGAFVATLERGQKILEELLVKAAASKDKVGVGDRGGSVGMEMQSLWKECTSLQIG